jgi:hypothetical protein
MISNKILSVLLFSIIFSFSGSCQTKEIFKLPSGPDGPGKFGAYYTHLKYDPEWDKNWRVGSEADVVVRFDDGGHRLVFWRGTSYVPCWVTENGIWYTNEFVERRGKHSINTDGCVEPMSDKQCRYSQVYIIESNDARAVIHWRYAPVDVRYEHPFIDPVTGWYDWVDEYYVIYPDATGVREVTVRSSGLNKWIEFQESIVINQPGTLPQENIEQGAVTVANMEGAYKTYYWSADGGPAFNENPSNANIIMINLKSDRKPFALVPAPPYDYNQINSFPGHGRNSNFNWWDHWPVSQDASDGRIALSAERPSHTSLCHIGLQKDLPVDCWGTNGYKTLIRKGILEWTVGEWSILYLQFNKTADLKDSVKISFDYANLWTPAVSIIFTDTDGEVKEVSLDEFKDELTLNQQDIKSFNKKISLSNLKGDANLSDICEVYFKLYSQKGKKTVKLDNLRFKSVQTASNSLDYFQDFNVPDGSSVEDINNNKNAGWEPYAEGGDTITKLMLHGLTTNSIQDLVPLAKSWINPPKLILSGTGYNFMGYDPEQKAYIINQNQNHDKSLQFDLLASKESPLVNPAFLIRNWGSSEIRLKVNGNPISEGKGFRTGHVETLDDTYLVIWIPMTSAEKNTFSISPIVE